LKQIKDKRDLKGPKGLKILEFFVLVLVIVIVLVLVIVIGFASFP